MVPPAWCPKCKARRRVYAHVGAEDEVDFLCAKCRDESLKGARRRDPMAGVYADRRTAGRKRERRLRKVARRQRVMTDKGE
jgi:hypothetical protein